MSTKQRAIALAGILGSLALAACDLDIPDLNNPGIDQLENNPTPAAVNTAATGLLVGNRNSKATTGGYVNLLGILGREAYDFDSADGRFVSELIQGNLSKASPFGGAFWTPPYANIRLGHAILHALEKVQGMTEQSKTGIKGFTHTIMALDLLTVITTHEKTGAVIDTDHPVEGPLGDFVSQDAVYAEIIRLLDLSQTELMAAGMTFSFPLSGGYAGFNTPPTFVKFNRAIRARVDVYMKNYGAALTDLGGSFIAEPATGTVDFKLGVYHVYSTNSGDAVNALINPAIYAHSSLKTAAEPSDMRYAAKVTTMVDDMTKEEVTVTYGSDATLTTKLKFKHYTNTAPVPVIRNEELILLKAEALWFTGDQPGAIAELNYVRQKSGGLAALATPPTDDASFIDALLYERRYSLMFEGGHRWLDLRRFGRELPLDSPMHTRNVRFPVPQAECDARPGEPACAIVSAD